MDRGSALLNVTVYTERERCMYIRRTRDFNVLSLKRSGTALRTQ